MQSNSITTSFVVPAEYKRIEYIQSDWWQYIDTNYTPTTSTHFYIKASSQWVANKTWLFGCRNSSTTNARFLSYIELTYNGSSNVIRVDVWNRNWNTWKTRSANTPFTIDVNLPNNIVKVNWSTIWTSISLSTSNIPTMALFANHDRTEWYLYPIAWRIYECQIYTWTTLQRDFYPVYRRSDNVVWLFDRVNKVFYTNNGTWSFTKWPDL